MNTDNKYESLINLLKDWLNEGSDQHLKYFGEPMRDRNKRIKSAIAPKIDITKKPEIDRILEEAEAHIPKKSRQSYCITVPKNEKIQSFTENLTSSQKPSDFISSVNKERIVSLLWEAYEANLESLKTLIGEDTRIKIAKERVSSCIEDWRLENAMD